MAHRHFGREAWARACELAAVPDGLPTVRTAGMWTAKKLFFLCLYLEQVLRGMHENKHFPSGLTYLDLFAGAGVSEVSDGSGGFRRFPGSALIAASLGPRSFSRLFLVDADANALGALRSRIGTAGFSGEVRAWQGDVNALIDEVAQALPARALNIAFIDPYSLDIHHETIRVLATKRPLDLIILFSDRIDLGRNVRAYYYDVRPSKLDHFLGMASGWRERYDALPDQSGPKVRELFADIYREQLGRLGYRHSKSWPLEGPRGPMFRLVYASKNWLGLKFCEIALREEFGGERGLFGPT